MTTTNTKKKQKKTKTKRFGSISLPISDRKTPFIPKKLPYREHGKIMQTIAYAVREDIPVLLIGETGVGKTSAVRALASQTKNSLRRVNVNGSMTAEDFIGQLLVRPVDGGGNETYWKDGVLTEALRNGYWIVIDEINAASAEILFALHSLLDDDKYIVLTDHPEREIVHAHPDFRIFATMNPPERYAGTQELNKALMSRFGITLEVPLPPSHIEYGILSRAKYDLSQKELGSLKNFVKEMRAAYNKEEIDVFVSPRDVAHIVKISEYTKSLETSVEMTIVPRGTEAERKAIKNLAKINLAPTAEKNPKQ